MYGGNQGSNYQYPRWNLITCQCMETTQEACLATLSAFTPRNQWRTLFGTGKKMNQVCLLCSSIERLVVNHLILLETFGKEVEPKKTPLRNLCQFYMRGTQSLMELHLAGCVSCEVQWSECGQMWHCVSYGVIWGKNSLGEVWIEFATSGTWLNKDTEMRPFTHHVEILLHWNQSFLHTSRHFSL